MIYFIIAWSLLAIVCCFTGIYLLNSLKANCFDRIGDRLMIATWSGLIVIPILLLAVSFAAPVSLFTGAVVAVILITLSLLSFSTRTELIRLKSLFSIDWLVAFLCLSLLTTALVNRRMIWFDTGGYHIGAIKWLAEAGTVPGIALINYAFGFTSSWFAFAAPLIPGFLGHRIGAVTNGFIFLLTALHVAIALTHVRQKQSRLSDWFAIVVFLIVIATYIATIFAGSPILISFSPDVPVTLVTGVIAWAILAIQEREASSPPVLPAIDVKTLPLILGVGAVSLKLSALPVLAIVVLFYCFESRFVLRRLAIGAMLVILLALPMIGYGFMSSGCPMFPSTTACINLPWRIPPEEAVNQLETTQVLQFEEPETSAADPNEGLPALLERRFAWLRTQRKMQVMLLLYVMSIALLMRQLLSSQSRKIQAGSIWINSLGILGMTFIIFYAPLVRFGLMYFVLIPGLAFAQLINSRYSNFESHLLFQRYSLYYLNKTLRRALALGLTCLFFIVLAEDQRYLISLLPPELPQPQLIEAQINDVEYTYPADWSYKCWAAPLPCSGIVLENVRLRKPEQGIYAGFVRVPQSVSVP